VREGTEVVQATSSSISLLVDESRVRDLPLNSKNFQRLVYLAPGVVGGFAANPSASGSRGSGNNWTIDGLGANEEREAGIGLSPAGNPPAVPIPNVLSTEAVQEFRVISANPDATFGRGSGAQINVITKSGTNQLHGSLYEYLRNDKTDARDFFNRGPFFDSKGRAQPPPFRQNLFGGSVGGPIREGSPLLLRKLRGLPPTSGPDSYSYAAQRRSVAPDSGRSGPFHAGVLY
jgi:hypothetical protein